MVEEEEKSGICHAFGRFCGGGKNSISSSPEDAEQEAPKATEQEPDISEDPALKHVVNANALIMMAVAVFLWGYYA